MYLILENISNTKRGGFMLASWTPKTQFEKTFIEPFWNCYQVIKSIKWVVPNVYKLDKRVTELEEKDK